MQACESRALVEDCLGGEDVEAWREFDRRFRERLVFGVRGALKRSGLRFEGADLEDYVQEVYCRLLDRDGRILRLCRGETDGQIGCYLQTIAERVTLDCIRHQVAQKRGGGVTHADGDASDAWPDDRRVTSPEERLLTEERRQLFFAKCRGALGKSGSRRDLYILYLALFDGCSSSEIARRLGGGLTTHGVDSRICRMRARLREREGIELPRRGKL